MIKEGEKVPEIEITDSNGKKTKLSDFKGKKIVLYFYPKDDTSGCTKEACNFRDDFEKFNAKNTKIIGISFDSNESHQKFAKKYKLPFTLLSDSNKEMAKKFGVYVNKGIFGKGIKRSTFIINEQGIIEKVFPKVKVEEHSKEILELI